MTRSTHRTLVKAPPPFPVPPPFPTGVAGLKVRLDSITNLTLGGRPASKGGSVDSWGDQSGLGNTPTQATGSKQPRWDWQVLNGYPGLYFGGAQNLLLTALNASLATTTIFCVARLDVGNSVCDYADGSGTGNRHLLCTRNVSGFKFSIYQGTAVISGPATSGNATIVTGRFSADANSYVEANAAGRVTGNAGANSLAGFRLGAEQGEAAGEWLIGYVFEHLIFSPSLNDADVTTVTNYLNSRYKLF